MLISVIEVAACERHSQWDETMSVESSYLAVGLMTIVGILFPLSAFILNRLLRPVSDSKNPNITKSYLIPGYETDHSLYPRRLTTYECGSDPVGDAMIQFHFQYYWYAIIFLVFDIAFMFLALGGTVAINSNEGNIDNSERAMMALIGFLFLMILGVWHVFRKRGKIYI